MKIRSVLALGALAIIIASCGSVNPKAPEVVVQEEFTIPEAPVSAIKVPIKINLKPYFDDTDASLDKSFTGGESQCSGVSYSYRFLRTPIKFEGIGDKLKFTVGGKYSLKLNYCPTCSDLLSDEPYCLSNRIYASCGVNEPMRGVKVSYTTEIGVDKNYHLKSTTKLGDVKALSPCKITAFDYDATSTLLSEVKGALKDLEKDIDSEIGAVSLKEDIQETWDLLQESTDLEGYGFMELNPIGMAVSKIRYRGDTAIVNALLHARPQILSKPSGNPPRELPMLSKYENRNGFDITMDIKTQYDSLTAILTREVKGTELDLSGKKVIFGDIAVHGASNQQLHIKVDFSGTKSGTLYLTGTPVFDKEKQHISFPDLDFDLETKSALLKSAKWLFDRKITKMMREEASMDLAPYLADLAKEVDSSINGYLDEDVYMWGKVKDIKIDLIQPMNDELFIRIHSLGKIGIKLL